MAAYSISRLWERRDLFLTLADLGPLAGHRRFDRRANCFNRAPHGVGAKVRVALRGGNLPVAEQLPDDRQSQRCPGAN
jgi:hypothetical protein